MGIGVEEWRRRIGMFSSPPGCKGSAHTAGLLLPVRFKPRLLCVAACVLIVLLVIGGVEQNPGPHAGGKDDDLAKRLDDLFQEIHDTRAALSTKIDDAMRDLTKQLLVCEQQVAAHNDRLTAIARAQATLQADVTMMKNSPPGATLTAASHTTSAQTAAPTVAMADVIRELELRASKKSNVIISGIKPSLSSDAEQVTNLLRHELSINVTINNCSRLGKTIASNTSPRPLLVTLSSEHDARTVLLAAKKLRESSDVYISSHVYVNADRTREQRVEEYNLRTELRRRRSAGELNLVIRNGHIIVRPDRQNARHGAHPPAAALP